MLGPTEPSPNPVITFTIHNHGPDAAFGGMTNDRDEHWVRIFPCESQAFRIFAILTLFNREDVEFERYEDGIFHGIRFRDDEQSGHYAK